MKGTLAARTQVQPMVYGVSEDFKQKKKKFCPCITDKYFLTQKMKYCRPVTQSILEIGKNEGHLSLSNFFFDQLKCPSFLRISNID